MKPILLFGGLLAGAVAFSAVALASPEGPARLHRAGRMQRRAARHLLAELNLTDAQKACIGDARTAAESARRDLREKIRAIFQDLRVGERTEEARTAAREKVRAAIGAALESVGPQAETVLRTLTAEQRATLERFAAARGRPTDEASLRKGISRLLLCPGHRRGR